MFHRPTIFISAASKELSSARQLVANTLSFLGYDPDWQDIFGTEEGDLREVLRRRIDAAKGVVQLVGKYYGAEPPSVDEKCGRVSYTQYEALYAKERGKKVWYLLLDESFPADPCEEESEKQKLQEAYREGVKADVHLYHALNSREALETSLLKLRDDLATLRRGVRRWAVAALMLLLVLAAGIAWLVRAQHRQTIVMQIQSQQVSAILDRNQKMQQALVRLAEVEAQSKQSGEKLTPEEQRARAYAVLEKELGLPAGTLAREMPGFALELYSRADTTPLMRARAAYALNKFDEAEKLSLEAGDQDQKAYETAKRVAYDRRKTALEAYELAGWSAEKRVEYADALAHLQRAEQLTDRARDPLEWARIQFAIGWILYDQGQYQQVESVLREVLKERERLLGAKDPETLAVRHYVARAVNSQGRLAEAEQEFRVILKLRQSVLNAQHPDTLSTRLNLAVILDEQGKYADAEAEYRSIISLQQRVLGPEHHDTLKTRINLAIVFAEQANYPAAEKEFKAVLKVQEKVLGPEHPDILETRDDLALALNYEGKFGEAEAEHRALIGIEEKLLGPAHPKTLITHGNLGGDLDALGKYADAEAEDRSAINLLEKALHREHPDVLNFRHELAGILVHEGKFTDAEVEYRAVLDSRAKLLGHDHPDSLATRGGLATAIAKQQRYAEAEMMFSEILPKLEVALGIGAPITLKLCEDYAECLKREGKLAQAKELAQRAAEGARKKLGPEHPDTKKYKAFWHDLETGLTKK